jgi:CIC family chloride channel protein
MIPAVFWRNQIKRLPPQARIVTLTIFYGVAAALTAVFFQWSIALVYDNTLKRVARGSSLEFLGWSFLIVVGSSAIVGWLLNNFCPEAAGSGIPQLKVAFWKDFGFVAWRTVWIKFVAGVISIGGGNSLGREGPSVHVAGGIASCVAGLLGEPKQTRRRSAAAGAAAGLAAAFNTPLAAITFVLEEIVEDLNSRLLGSVLLASLIGAFIVHGLIGKQPAFALSSVDAISFRAYLLAPFVAGVASLVGIIFQNSSLAIRRSGSWFRFVPRTYRPVIGGGITWMLGSGVFLLTGHLGVFSLGYDDLSQGLTTGLPWKIALILLAAKLIATIVCYGFGGCGGIFSPTLFLGAMCGLGVAGLADLLSPIPGEDHLLLAVVGMSACLGSVVRAPLTGLLIVFEMTHQFALIPALMISGLVSQAIARRLTAHNFYESVLEQDGHQLKHVMPPKDLQSWRQTPARRVINTSLVSIDTVDRAGIEQVLSKYPYNQFPVIIQGEVKGILTRKEASAAFESSRSPRLEPVTFCQVNDSIGVLQGRLIESTTGAAVVLDQEQKVSGIVTLHDLLRAELAAADGLVD